MPIAHSAQENLIHPYYSDVTLDSSLNLSRQLSPKSHTPVHPTDPIPTIEEALNIIQSAQKRMGFNWLTGHLSLQVLQVANGGNPEIIFTT